MNLIQADVKRLPLADESIDMVFTDPPYIKDQVHTYEWVIQEAARVLKPGKFIAVMCANQYLDRIFSWFQNSGLEYYYLYNLKMGGQRSGMIWKNGGPGITPKPVVTRTKYVLVYSKGKAVSRTSTVGTFYPGQADKKYHHWGQSIGSHRYYIDCFSAPGDLVLDPMCGGGTTAAACKIIGRHWICSDIEWNEVQTTKRRMNNEMKFYADLPMFKQEVQDA